LLPHSKEATFRIKYLQEHSMPFASTSRFLVIPLLLATTAWGQTRPQSQSSQATPAHHHDMSDMGQMGNMANMPGMNASSADHQGMNPQAQAEAQAMRAMQPGHIMDMTHMRMTGLRPATPKDLQRADQIVATLKDVLEPYKDYRVALANGYQIFLPQMPQHEYHFNNYWNGFVESFTFDPSRPTSLLYKKTRDGYELTGAMYTAPRTATLDQLDARVPLSVAHWHVHINLCMPRRNEMPRADWKLFGLTGSIWTEEACQEARGQFFPQVFGWMVHVYPYAPSDKIFAH
jgi:hypothetical protein